MNEHILLANEKIAQLSAEMQRQENGCDFRPSTPLYSQLKLD